MHGTRDDWWFEMVRVDTPAAVTSMPWFRAEGVEYRLVVLSGKMRRDVEPIVWR